MKNVKLQNLLLIIGFAALFEACSNFMKFPFVHAEKKESIVMLKTHNNMMQPLPEAICTHAKKTNHHLNKLYNDTLFNTKLLRDPKKMGAHLALPHKKDTQGNSGHAATDCTIKTSDGALIATTFIDHQSDTLLVIGSGFSYDRRSLASFACYNQDIVLFQPRGTGIDHKPKTFKGRCSHKLMGVDSSVCKLGSVEEHDIIAVTEYYKKQKNYKSVCYLGICYSAVIGAKASVLRPDLFDKLILDGSWPSLNVLINRIIQQPELLRNPQTKAKPMAILAHNTLYKNSSLACTQKLFNFKIDQAIEGSSFLPRLHKPILFFHGLDDVMVPRSDFEAVWDMVGTQQKVAVYTPSRHIQAHIKHKELYHMLCHLFIKYDFATFTGALNNPELFKSLSIN